MCLEEAFKNKLWMQSIEYIPNLRGQTLKYCLWHDNKLLFSVTFLRCSSLFLPSIAASLIVWAFGCLCALMQPLVQPHADCQPPTGARLTDRHTKQAQKFSANIFLVVLLLQSYCISTMARQCYPCNIILQYYWNKPLEDMTKILLCISEHVRWNCSVKIFCPTIVRWQLVIFHVLPRAMLWMNSNRWILRTGSNKVKSELKEKQNVAWDPESWVQVIQSHVVISFPY